MGNKVNYAVFNYHVNYPNLGLILDEFVPYEQALALKELGYDIPTSGSYTDKDTFNLTTGGRMYRVTPSEPQFCIAPLYQEAFAWLKKHYKIMVCVDAEPINNFENWLNELKKLIKQANNAEKIKL